MKKILLLLTLISFSCIGQNNPAYHRSGARMPFVQLDTLTATERDALTIPSSASSIIYNSTVDSVQYKVPSGGWKSFGSGGGTDDQTLQEVIDQGSYAGSPDGFSYIDFTLSDAGVGNIDLRTDDNSGNNYSRTRQDINDIYLYNVTGGKFGDIKIENGAIKLTQSDAAGNNVTEFDFTLPIANTLIKLPAKTIGTYTLAVLSDIDDIDETQLDASVNSSLDLADSSIQPTGSQTITGTKTYNSSSGSDTNINSINDSTGNGIVHTNQSTSSGIGISSNGDTGSTGLIYRGSLDGATTFSVTKEGNVTGNSFIKTGATADDILLGDGTTSSLSEKVSSDGTGRTAVTEYSNLYGQTQAGYTTDGAPAGGTLVVITDASPAEVVTTATIAMDGWKMYDDQTADAATLTLSDCDPGESLTMYINRASMPTLDGVGLTFNPLPNTTAFAAATEMAIYFEVAYDGTTIDYYLYER